MPSTFLNHILRVWPWLFALFYSQAFAQTYQVGLHEAHHPTEKDYALVYPKVFAHISALTGDEFKFQYLPASRVKKYFIEGKIDIEPGVHPAWRVHEKVPGHYTIAFANSVNILVHFPATQQSVDKVLGTVNGFRYPNLERHFRQGSLKRFDLPNQTELLKKLVAGRLSQVVVAEHFARLWLAQNAKPGQYRLGEVVDRKPIMIRVHPNHKAAIERFNKALQTLIDNGTMRRLTGFEPQKP